MTFEERTIICAQYDINTKMSRPFRVGVYTFNYETNLQDRTLIDGIIANATSLANKVNPGAANNSNLKREYGRILNNCIAGVLSEHLWKIYLNSNTVKVRNTQCTDVSTQIDLQIISNNKKIEVRSSFPRNGIDFAICSSQYEFDIIGMYSNGYKPAEIQKDYYVRALFHLGIERYWQKDPNTSIAIIEKISEKIKKDSFEAFLTGGATWNMMIDNNVAKNKTFIPEDEISLNRLASKTSYRVVPFCRALDTREIYNLVYNEN